MFYIYRITNKVNGKTYIGQHKYKKLNDRYMGSGILLAKAAKAVMVEAYRKSGRKDWNVFQKEYKEERCAG